MAMLVGFDHLTMDQCFTAESLGEVIEKEYPEYFGVNPRISVRPVGQVERPSKFNNYHDPGEYGTNRCMHESTPYSEAFRWNAVLER